MIGESCHKSLLLSITNRDNCRYKMDASSYIIVTYIRISEYT